MLSVYCNTAPPLATEIVSRFTQNVIDTLRDIDALSGDGKTGEAVRILERPFAEIAHSRFATSGEGWMGLAGRFHRTITQGLARKEIPLEMHNFLQDTFFSEDIDIARFKLYFKTIADILRDEVAVEPQDVERDPTSETESGVRPIKPSHESDEAPTLRSGQLVGIGVDVEAESALKQTSDTIPAPSQWFLEKDAKSPNDGLSQFVTNIMTSLKKLQILPEGATPHDAVEVFNNPYGNLFCRLVPHRIAWMGLGIYFHQTIIKDLAAEDIPPPVYELFETLYFMDFAKDESASDYGAYEDQIKFENYFAILAAVIAEETTGETPVVRKPSSVEPRSDTQPIFTDPNIDQTAATPRYFA